MRKIIALAPIGAAIIVTAAFAQGLPPSAESAPKAAAEETSKAPPIPALTDAKTGTMYVAENAQDFMSSRLVGAKVTGPGNEAVGDVPDLMLGQDGSIRAVIISVGGVLGVGARYIAVAPTGLKMSRENDQVVKVTLQASKDDLKAAPEFKYQGKPG